MKPRDFSEYITAAAVDATTIDINSKVGFPGLASETARETKAKQLLAWNAYNTVGEIRHIARSIVGSSIQNLAWYPGYVDDDPSYTYVPPLTDQMSEKDVAFVTELVKNIHTPYMTQAEFMETIGINLFIAGEIFIDEKNETYELVPATNIQGSATSTTTGKPKTTYTYTNPLNTSEKITDAPLRRLWQPHPMEVGKPDSALFAIVDLVDELKWIQRLIMSLFRKRIYTSGIMAVSNSFLGPDADLGDADSVAGAVNKFEKQIIDQVTVDISDDTSHPMAPIFVFGPFEHIKDGIVYHAFDNELPDTIIKERRELERRIANGLDVPTEYMLGLGETSHWSAWLIRDLLWINHVRPLSINIADGITSQIITPKLQKAKKAGQFSGDPERVKLWFQQAQMQTHPDLYEFLLLAHDKGIVGKEPILRLLGIPEQYAITDEEFERWLTLRENQNGFVDPGEVRPDGAIQPESPSRRPNRRQQPRSRGANRDRAGEDGPSQR